MTEILDFRSISYYSSHWNPSFELLNWCSHPKSLYFGGLATPVGFRNNNDNCKKEPTSSRDEIYELSKWNHEFLTILHFTILVRPHSFGIFGIRYHPRSHSFDIYVFQSFFSHILSYSTWILVLCMLKMCTFRSISGHFFHSFFFSHWPNVNRKKGVNLNPTESNWSVSDTKMGT